MKKTELIHLHALLAMVADDFERRGIVDGSDLADYRRLDVTPMALRRPRDDHEEAVRTLAAILGGEADTPATAVSSQ